jgi:hypothetical protein
MSSWSFLTQDDLVIFSSFSSFVASLPTVGVQIKVSQSSGWVTWVRSISHGIELFTEFVLNLSFPAWLSLSALWKWPTEADWGAMFPTIFEPYISAAIPMLFWFTALHQDMPLVSQLFPGTSYLIRRSRSWLAIIIDIIGFKATSSSSVFNVMSTITTARLLLYYYKPPSRKIYIYHAELMNSFIFMVVWAVVIITEM